jgi:hypothetical protein
MSTTVTPVENRFVLGWPAATAQRDDADGLRLVMHAHRTHRALGFSVRVDIEAEDVHAFIVPLMKVDLVNVVPVAHRVLLWVGVQKFEAHIREGKPIPSDGGVLSLVAEPNDIEAYAQAQDARTCDEQAREGRALVCRAGAHDLDDKAHDPLDRPLRREGSLRILKTTEKHCAGCALPDSRIVCSHLRWPEVKFVPTVSLAKPVWKRDVQRAVCEKGRAEVERNPGSCRGGGHQCWERAVDFNGAQGSALWAVVGNKVAQMVEEVEKVFDYDIALSFAGENRPIVEEIAKGLVARGIKVFYDSFEEANLWGTDLYQHLHEIYSRRARYCMIFISEAYVRKVWTSHELRSAQERALAEKGNAYILPVRIDDTEVAGIMKQIGFLDARQKTVADLVGIAAEKMRGLVKPSEPDTRIGVGIPVSPCEKLKASVEASRADQGTAARAFMQSAVEALKAIDPHERPGDPVESLVKAIESTVPLVREFSSVCETIAAHGAKDAATSLFQSLERILALTDRSPDSSGQHKTSDFDLYKFACHELVVTFTACLLREDRWELLNECLQLQFQTDYRGAPILVGVEFFCNDVYLLEEVLRRKVATKNSISRCMQADMLKARHDKDGVLGDTVNWTEFRDADLFLYLRPRRVKQAKNWWPRTWPYLARHTPSYFVRSLSLLGTKKLMMGLGLTSPVEAKAQVVKAMEQFYDLLRSEGAYFPMLDFDVKTIAEA